MDADKDGQADSHTGVGCMISGLLHVQKAPGMLVIQVCVWGGERAREIGGGSWFFVGMGVGTGVGGADLSGREAERMCVYVCLFMYVWGGAA